MESSTSSFNNHHGKDYERVVAYIEESSILVYYIELMVLLVVDIVGIVVLLVVDIVGIVVDIVGFPLLSFFLVGGPKVLVFFVSVLISHSDIRNYYNHKDYNHHNHHKDQHVFHNIF